MTTRPLAVVLTVAAALAGPASAGSIVDQRGREHVFDRPAERVVTIAIPQFWIYMAVDGGPQHIVAANPTAVAQMRPSILASIFPDAVKVPTNIIASGSFVPNVEELLKLKPDVVFQWADRGDELVDALDRVGLRAIGVKNTASETDFAAWASLMGAASGKEERVREMLADQQAALQRLEQAITAVPEAEKPRVLVLQQYSKTLTVIGGNSYQDIFVRRAGGIDVAAALSGSAGNVAGNMEQIIVWQPDIILLSQFEEKNPADMYADPLWQAVKAVRDRRVYKLPFGGSRWGGSDQETPLFWTWLAGVQHPGRFGLDLRGEMRRLYRFLYGYDLQAADIDRILAADANRVSADYGQFLRE